VLAFWLVIVVVSGLTAAIAFPAMKALGPQLPDYPAGVADHWKIAAGQIANPVFTVALRVEVVCGVIAIACALAGMRRSSRTLGLTIGLAPLTIAAGALAYHWIVLAPRMAAALDRFLALAKAGDPGAAVFRAAFDADHPAASTTLGIIACSLALTLVALLLPTSRRHR